HWESVELPPLGGGLAVCGPADEARSLALWLVGQLVLSRTDVSFRAPGWAPGCPRREGEGLLLVVTEEPGAPPRPAAITIVVCRAPAQAPRWCSRVVLAAPEHERRVSP